MTSLSQAKTLGGVGSILLILGVVPSAGPVLAIVGLVLILVAVKNISDAVKDKAIFNDMLLGTILAIIGVAVGALILFASFANLVFGGFTTTSGFTAPFDIFAILTAVILGLAVLWVFLILWAIFLRRSFNKIASLLNVGAFRTAATLYLIGAALVIVFVGFVLIFVADIFLIIAFFSIPEQAPQAPSVPQPTVTTS